jgi:ubiquinone biosynthesis protein
MPEARRYQPVEIAGHYARSLERELDLGIEARNLERFGATFAGHPYLVIPKVYPEWTSETLNVQEQIVGIPGTDLAAVKAAGLDPKLLAARGAQAILKMILVDGFFHADPHPGNVFYLPDNRMAVIDFGMVGRLSPVRRNQVIDLLAGLARMDEDAMLDTLVDWAGDAYVDEAKLAADVNELVFEFEGTPLKDIRVGVLVRRLTTIVREHSIVMPADLALMFKAMITMEGLGRQYDPDFHILDHLAPLLRKAIAQRYRPAGMLRRGRNTLGQFVDLVSSIPRDLGRLLRDARRGKTRVGLDIKQLDTFGKQLDRSIGRATMGIMTASVVIGSSIVMTVQGGPQVFGMPLFQLLGFLGYAMAFFNSLWVIIGIWRSGNA